jgi:hypothetical protein
MNEHSLLVAVLLSLLAGMQSFSRIRSRLPRSAMSAVSGSRGSPRSRGTGDGTKKIVVMPSDGLEVRVNKCLGGLSRRGADAVIEEGRVTVNGAVALPGTKVRAGDKVRLDGQLQQWEGQLLPYLP